MIYQTAGSIKEGVGMAAESIDTGRAAGKLKEFIEYTKN
jgi:anthranilate phosphoribosyltransferase